MKLTKSFLFFINEENTRKSIATNSNNKTSSKYTQKKKFIHLLKLNLKTIIMHIQEKRKISQYNNVYIIIIITIYIENSSN